MNTQQTPIEPLPAPAWLDAPFALFAGATYYPSPGWQGHMGQYGNIEAATEKGKTAAEEMYGWWQVVDLRTLEIVAGEGSGHTGLCGKCEAGPSNDKAEAPSLSEVDPPAAG